MNGLVKKLLGMGGFVKSIGLVGAFDTSKEY